MIELKDMSFSYGTQRILDRCSLTVPDGAHYAVMGPSGQGKTTLFRLILGLEQPSGGAVRCTGKFSCVFQEPRLLPWCSALENIRAVLPDDAPDTAAMQALEELELSAAANMYPEELSGGMQQRLALARALAYGGDTLLLDEPFKGCDPALYDRVTALLRQKCVGKTLLLITHDEQEARALTERTLFLNNGSISIM